MAIAASAGGLPALIQVLSPLPADFPAAILVAQHMGRRQSSRLAPLLARRLALPVHEVEDGELLLPGHVYVAPPGRHLVATGNGMLHTPALEPVNFTRPAADLLFQSLALGFGQRAAGMVLTGAGCDSAVGVQLLKAFGGTVLAQDPTSAQMGQMPAAAIRTGCVDFVLPLERLSAALVSLAAVPGAAPRFGIPHPARGFPTPLA